MADVAGADPGAEEPDLRHAGLDHDIAEVKRLFTFSRRPSVARHLAFLVSELQQVRPVSDKPLPDVACRRLLAGVLVPHW